MLTKYVYIVGIKQDNGTNKEESNMRIALTGNPNSGKTTMYNALTGRNERVGNWAGVTV